MGEQSRLTNPAEYDDQIRDGGNGLCESLVGGRDLEHQEHTDSLATNAIYLARISTSAMKIAKSKASEALQTGEYESDSLYLLDESVVRQAAGNVNTDIDVLARIDGFSILAPGWKKCTDCPSPPDSLTSELKQSRSRSD